MRYFEYYTMQVARYVRTSCLPIRIHFVYLLYIQIYGYLQKVHMLIARSCFEALIALY